MLPDRLKENIQKEDSKTSAVNQNGFSDKSDFEKEVATMKNKSQSLKFIFMITKER